MKLKELNIFLITGLFMLMSGCFQNGSKRTPSRPLTKYIAHHDIDTAIALIDLSENSFKGLLEINYHGAFKDSGEVKGVVKGDTLIGDYHFQHYKLPKWFRKPITFLKKGDKLIMGEGVLKLTVGIPHFHPAIPIDFDENKRFVFEKK